MKPIKLVSVFLVIQLLACFIAWCGGFDFNYRNTNTGSWVFLSFGLGFLIAPLIAMVTE